MSQCVNIVKPDNGRAWTKRALLWLLLVAGAGAAYWAGDRSAPSGVPQGLRVAPDSLDFGEVWQDTAFAWKLAIHNDRPKEIEILGFHSSCSCVAVRPAKLTIASGETRELELVLDLTQTGARPDVTGRVAFEAQIRPRIEDAPVGRDGWRIHGKVRPLLDINPPQVRFGTLVRGQPWPSRSVKIKAAVALDHLLARTDPAQFDISVKRHGPKDFEVRISPLVGLPMGHSDLNITVEARAPTEQSLVRKLLSVEAYVREDILPIPRAVIFGALAIGSTISQTVVLRSLSGDPFEVESLKSSAANLKVDVLRSETSSAAVFQVTQAATSLGNQKSQVTLKVRKRDSSTSEVRLQVLYFGIENHDISEPIKKANK